MSESTPGPESMAALQKIEKAVNDFIENHSELSAKLLSSVSLIDLSLELDRHRDTVEIFFQERRVKRGEGRRALQNAFELLWANKDSPDKARLQ